jgi:ATP-dependent RNA helicase DeaD
VDKLLLAVEKEDLEKYKGLAEGLLEETDAVTLLSAALKVLTKEPERTSVILTGERAPGTKKKKSDNAGQRGYNRIGSSK